MLIVLSFIGIFLVLISYVRYKRIINPSSLLIIWYFILVWLSRIGLYDMYIPTKESSELVLGNVCVMSFITILLSGSGSSNLTDNDIEIAKHNDQYGLFYKQWWLKVRKYCEIICFITVAIIDLNIIIRLLSGGLAASQIRYMLFQEDATSIKFLYFNGFVRDFLTYFVRFFVFFDVLIEICSFFMYRSTIRLLPVFNFGLFCIAILTRIDILKIGLIILTCFLFARSPKKERKRMPFKTKMIIFIAVLLFGIVISLRVYDGDSIIEFTTKNLTISILGSLQAFSQVMERLLRDGPVVEFSVIREFFSGITAIVDAFLVNGLKINIPFIEKELNSYIGGIIFIGPRQTFNAFYTMYYQFMATGGIFGTFVGSILCGTALSISYNRFKCIPSLASCMVFAIWEYILLFGIIKWNAGLTEWACVLLLVFGSRINIGNKSNIDAA